MAISTENAVAIDVRGALRTAISQLREADAPSHALAAELLLLHTLGRDRAWIYSHPEAPLDAAAAEKYFALVTRRAAGVPTQYLTGKQEFWGLEFAVTSAVLIPRPETEHVVEAALARLGASRTKESLRIVDVGTGSGCIAVALAKELPRAALVATDISGDALAVAQENAVRHGVAERIEFLECNLLEAIAGQRGQFDLIVSNPPYVARSEESDLPRDVREHEPHSALFGGPSGTEIYAPLIAHAAELLHPGGWLVMEIGFGAEEQIRALLEPSHEWTAIEVTNDLAGIPRVVSASRA
jgi:release factor glutamine methyltransferase